MKERSPTRIVETCHEGFHSLGWKSEKEKHRRVLVWKRPGTLAFYTHKLLDLVPEGVIIVTAGGLNGYSGGNFKVPRVRQLDSQGATHILSTIIRCIWRSFNEVVPEKNVLFGWMGCDIWRRGLLNSLIFLRKLSLSALKQDGSYPFVTCLGGHAERR